MNSSTQTADDWPQPNNKTNRFALSGGLITVFYAVFCALSLVPFLSIAYPPIVDFANHAARLNLACNSADPLVASMYGYRLGIIPNLAIDLVNVPACGVLDPKTVLKLVTAVSLLLIYFSGWLIQRKLFGRANSFIFLLPATAFNLVTTMGYINFLAGVAVVCFMVAVAIGREDQFKTLLLLCNAGGLILFFCHIFALAVAVLVFFGLMVRGAGLHPKRIAVAALRSAALFALPLALLTLVPTSSHELEIGYEGKIRVLNALFMAQHASIGILGILLLVPLYFLLKARIVEVHAFFRVPLAVLGLYILLVPSQLKDAVDIDSRTIVAAAYLFFVSLRPIERESELTFAVGSLAAALVGFQLWATTTIWEPFSRQVDEFRDAVRILPPHATVLSVSDYEGPNLIAFPIAYSHLASYATTDRLIFNPLEFTGIGMQPLSVTPAFASFDTPAGQPFSPDAANRLATPTARIERKARKFEADYALRWPQRFDYVVYYHFGGANNFNPVVLKEVHRGSFFSILQVKRPAHS